MKAYIINFNPLILPAHELMAYLDSRMEILNWYSPFSGTILIASNSTVSSLADLIALRFPMHLFLINEVSHSTVNGRMPVVTWDFVTSPKSSGRWDGALLRYLKEIETQKK